MRVRGWRNCVGVRTRLLPDAAAMPGWEEMTSDVSGEKGRGEGQRIGRGRRRRKDREEARGQEEGGGGRIQSPAKQYSKYITNVPCGATRVPAHLLSQ